MGRDPTLFHATLSAGGGWGDPTLCLKWGWGDPFYSMLHSVLGVNSWRQTTSGHVNILKRSVTTNFKQLSNNY